MNTFRADDPESKIFTPLIEAENAVVAALVKLSVAEADVAATDDGITEDDAGENVPLTTRVTSNVLPPLLK